MLSLYAGYSYKRILEHWAKDVLLAVKNLMARALYKSTEPRQPIHEGKKGVEEV